MRQSKPIKISELTDVAETLLFPLLSRCVETVKQNGILRDPKSVEILDALDYEVGRARLSPSSQLGACLRTIILDEQVCKFLQMNPDGIVVNIGCGLDTRFSRVDNGRVHWFDLDLPQILEIRKHFFSETDRYKFVAKSALDPSWTDTIPKKGKLLFIMEGLSYYFAEDENRRFLFTVKSNFPNSEFLMEIVHPFFIKISSIPLTRNPLEKRANRLLKCGIKSGREIEQWFEGVRFIEEWFVIGKEKHRFPLLNRILFTLFPALTRMNKIVHLRFQ